MKKTIFSIVIVAMMFATNCVAQSNTTSVTVEMFRVGYMNKSVIIESMPEMVQFKSDYSAQQKEYEMELDVMVVKYNKLVKKYLALDKEVNKTIRNARQAEITEMELRIDRYKTNYQKALAEYESIAAEAINARVLEAVKVAAQDLKVNMVLDNVTPIYVDDKCVDMTSHVMQLLNKAAE